MIDFTTHPLFPDLLENQRRSVQYFFEKGILEELELFSTIGAESNSFEFSNGRSRIQTPFTLLESSKNSTQKGLGVFQDSITKISILGKEKENTFISSSEIFARSYNSFILHASKFVFKRPQFSQAEAILFQKTYSAGLYIPISLGLSRSFPPQWFYLGEIPLMTERGSFLINGAPRVLVNQIVRCPSVYFKVKLDEKNR